MREHRLPLAGKVFFSPLLMRAACCLAALKPGGWWGVFGALSGP